MEVAGDAQTSGTTAELAAKQRAGAAAALATDQFEAKQLVGRDRSRACERVVLGHDDDKRFGAPGAHVQGWILGGPFHGGHVEGAGQQEVGNLRIGRNLHLPGELRRAAVEEALEVRRNIVGGNVPAAADGHLAAVGGVSERLGALEQGLRVGQGCASPHGERTARVAPVDQRDAERRLELLELQRHGRLREPQSPRGFVEAPRFRQRHEGSDEVEVQHPGSTVTAAPLRRDLRHVAVSGPGRRR